MGSLTMRLTNLAPLNLFLPSMPHPEGAKKSFVTAMFCLGHSRYIQ